jgi:hypothetical protein
VYLFLSARETPQQEGKMLTHSGWESWGVGGKGEHIKINKVCKLVSKRVFRQLQRHHGDEAAQCLYIYIYGQVDLNVTERNGYGNWSYRVATLYKSRAHKNNFITHRVFVLSFIRVRKLGGRLYPPAESLTAFPDGEKGLKLTFFADKSASPRGL